MAMAVGRSNWMAIALSGKENPTINQALSYENTFSDIALASQFSTQAGCNALPATNKISKKNRNVFIMSIV